MTLEIHAGPWSFWLPEDWKAAGDDPAVPYFESGDGTWGCYIKVLQFAGSAMAPGELAARVQAVHAESLASLPDTAWEIQAREASSSDSSAESTIDHLDSRRTYRIVSHVRVAAPLGLQITLHHYLCEAYEESAEYSHGIFLSVRRDAPS